jgi:hypothetical protein
VIALLAAAALAMLVHRRLALLLAGLDVEFVLGQRLLVLPERRMGRKASA